MTAKLWHMTLGVENMELMRDFYTRVIGLEEADHWFAEDSETPSPTPGAMQIPGLNEWHGTSRDVKIEDQKYRDEDHDIAITLMKFHNRPSDKLDKLATFPFFRGHVAFFVDNLPSILQTMEQEQIGKIIHATGPDGVPNHAYISDPEGNAVELQAKQPNE